MFCPFKIKPYWPWLNLGLFLVSTGMRWDGTLCPWLHLSIAGLLFKSFLKASCFTELCRWKGSSNTLPPKPNAPSLPFMPLCLALYCIVKPRGNYNTWLYFFFFSCGQEQVVQQSTLPKMVYAHTQSFISCGPSFLKTKSLWRWKLYEENGLYGCFLIDFHGSFRPGCFIYPSEEYPHCHFLLAGLHSNNLFCVKCYGCLDIYMRH